MSDITLEEMATITEEDVKTAILSRLTTNLQTREGSFVNDVISGMAIEITNVLHSMAALLPMFYVDETSGKYIDRRAGDLGLTRKPGTKATCPMTFSGEDGASIPSGTLFYTTGGLTYTLDEEITLLEGTATGTLTADDVGVAYNVGAGEVNQTIKNYDGITAYTNGAATGGTDAETDADLCRRLYQRLRRPPTSSNPYQYQNWAESINGVGAARIVSKWDGPGTVKVILASQAMETVAGDVVDAVHAYIETHRPVGPAVTVVSAAAHDMAISAAVSIDGTTTKETVRTAFEQAVRGYLRSLVSGAFADTIDRDFDTMDGKTYTVNYNHLVYLLLRIPGVTDYTSLTSGGGTSNIILAADEVPVLTGVSVS